MSSPVTIEQLVRCTTVGDAFPKRDQRELVTIPSSCTIQDAIHILAEAKVLSAPVQDKSGGYLGLVDMFDLLAEVMRAFTEHHKVEEGDVHLNWITWVNDSHRLNVRGNILAEQPVTFLISTASTQPVIQIVVSPLTTRTDLSKRNPLRFVTDKSPLLELLLNFKESVHRVIVKKNNTNELLRIVSQSDMLQFIRANLTLCGDWKDKPLSELKSTAGGGGGSSIVSVNTHTRALFAFIQMHTQGVSAVAVVDSQGILVGSISVSDLRSLAPTQLESLQLPVMEFLAQRHTNAPTTPISCSATATVAEVVELLAATRVHRVWVVEEPWKKPIGIVSLTDVMRSFFDRVGGSDEVAKM